MIDELVANERSSDAGRERSRAAEPRALRAGVYAGAAAPRKPVAGSKAVIDLTKDTNDDLPLSARLPTTPATAPRPTISSQPDAQLPEFFCRLREGTKG